jgi:MSHA biogenesis protein MshM
MEIYYEIKMEKAMYLEHFKLNKAPFTLTPNTDFFCELATHQTALNVLLLSLAQNESFIKIVGEVGTGKTLLCRILLNKLAEDYVTVHILNPDQTSDSLLFAIACELNISAKANWTQHQILGAINSRLLELNREGKKTVLIIDEAQALSKASLETVRLLTNLETEEQKLLQIVLFGQPELDSKLEEYDFRHLKQRIMFSYRLQPLSRLDQDKYLSHRLSRAGYTYGNLFTEDALKKLHKASRGLPRLLNILCHKSLLVTYGQGKEMVDKHAVNRAVADTESAGQRISVPTLITFLGLGLLTVSAVLTIYWNYGLVR